MFINYTQSSRTSTGKGIARGGFVESQKKYIANMV